MSTKAHEYQAGDKVMLFSRYGGGPKSVVAYGKWRPAEVVAVKVVQSVRYGAPTLTSKTMLEVRELGDDGRAPSSGNQGTIMVERRKNLVLPRAFWDETEGPTILAATNKSEASGASGAAQDRAIAMKLAGDLLDYTTQSVLADVLQKQEVTTASMRARYGQFGARHDWLQENHGMVTDARAELEKRGLIRRPCASTDLGSPCGYLQDHGGDCAAKQEVPK